MLKYKTKKENLDKLVKLALTSAVATGGVIAIPALYEEVSANEPGVNNEENTAQEKTTKLIEADLKAAEESLLVKDLETARISVGEISDENKIYNDMVVRLDLLQLKIAFLL